MFKGFFGVSVVKGIFIKKVIWSRNCVRKYGRKAVQ